MVCYLFYLVNGIILSFTFILKLKIPLSLCLSPSPCFLCRPCEQKINLKSTKKVIRHLHVKTSCHLNLIIDFTYF